MRIASCLSFAALLIGCAPTLDQVARTTQAFAVKERCSQGPFELHVPAFGSTWGEDVTLEARGDGVSGHSTMSIGTGHVIEDTFTGDGVDPSACMLSDADRAAVAAGGTGASTTQAADSTDSTGSAGSTPSAPSTRSAGSTVALLAAGMPMSWLHKTEIARYHNEVSDWKQAHSVLKRGEDIKIVFWSEHPLDLHNTVFVLTHSEMVAPGGDDKKWQAHLDALKSDDEKAVTEARAKEVEEQRCIALRTTDKKCHDEGIKTGSERIAYADLQRTCEALAKNNATDKACRDDGWRNDNERPEWHAESTVQAQSTNTTTTPPPQKPADRPPPAPQAEAQSPKPSTNAEWIPGSWQWNGADWVWLGGGWRVPEQDRVQKLTATAPTAPPPVVIEARPVQPIASAVWADGYWHYQGTQWVWVPGHWAVPPRANATWRPSTWVQDGVRLRLDPGGWR